jgi:hypothetical protein
MPADRFEGGGAPPAAAEKARVRALTAEPLPAPQSAAKDQGVRAQVVARVQAAKRALEAIPTSDPEYATCKAAFDRLDRAADAALYVHRIPGSAESKAGARHDAGDPATAEKAFQQARANLLDVNRWQGITGGPTAAAFELHGPDGKPKAGSPREGDFIKINVPPAGEDWVQIEKIRDDPAKVEIVVRPSRNPKEPNDPRVQHFFTDESVNVFTVEKEGTAVKTGVHGMNERPNKAENLFGDIRNWVANATGSHLGLQQKQWNDWTRGIIYSPRPRS